jgi:large subunit ribosomal protein L30
MTPTPSEQAAAVLNLIERGVIGWNEPDVVKVLNRALKAGAPRKHRQQRSNAPLKMAEQAPSARMTRAEMERVARIRFDLAQHGINPELWAVEVLARGATLKCGDKTFSYVPNDEWRGFKVRSIDEAFENSVSEKKCSIFEKC